MKKFNKILAVASTVMFLTCTVGVETQAEVILNEKGVPIELKYSSETPSLDEIFQDMQILENYVEERRDTIPFADQEKAYLICLNKLLNQCAIQSQEQTDCKQAVELLIEYNAKYEDFEKIVFEEAAKGAVGTCAFWSNYLRYLLSKAKINNHVLSLRGASRYGHSIVIYRITKTAPWMVLTCGYNPARRKLPSGLTLEQYLLDYIDKSPKDTQINLVPKSFDREVNTLTFRKGTSQKFTPEVIDMYIDHLLTKPGAETALTRAIDSIKAQKK